MSQKWKLKTFDSNPVSTWEHLAVQAMVKFLNENNIEEFQFTVMGAVENSGAHAFLVYKTK